MLVFFRKFILYFHLDVGCTYCVGNTGLCCWVHVHLMHLHQVWDILLSVRRYADPEES